MLDKLLKPSGFFVIFLFVISLFSCPNNSPAVKIYPKHNTVKLKVGEVHEVEFVVVSNGKKVQNKEIEYHTSNPNVAVVDSNGVIKAAGEGKCQILANYKNKTGTCNLIVENVYAKRISLNHDKLDMDRGMSETLFVSFDPSDVTDSGVSWSSSDQNVATVSPEGVVEAVGEGQAIITALATDASKSSADCVVNVKVALEQIRFEESDVVFDGIEKKTFKVLFTPADATNKNITFSSSDGDVVTINANGEIQSMGVGSATITATSEDGGLEACCSCIVNEVPATGITFDQMDDTELIFGETYTINPRLVPENSTDKLEFVYSVDDSSIAELNANALQAVALGSLTFRVELKDKDNIYIEKSFDVINTLCFSGDDRFSLISRNGRGGKTWDGIIEYYSFADKKWRKWDGNEIASADNNSRNVIHLRGLGNTVISGDDAYNNFKILGDNISCSGDIRSLLNYRDVNNAVMGNSCFAFLFRKNPSIISAPALPAENLTGQCYESMFEACTSLTQAPALPAENLADCCYAYMFDGCTSLTQAPALPAENLTESCYSFMFKGCTSLTQAPALIATTIAENCYQSMFEGCTSLTSAPALPAENLTEYCYSFMFEGCTSLTSAPALPAKSLAECCYYSMFEACTSLTQAPALPAESLEPECYRYMFSGCTSLTQAPALPAENLANSCYYSMFGSCTSLTSAPALPVKTLAISCYESMFKDCTSLTQAPALPAESLAECCYESMFSGCTSLRRPPALPATGLADSCYLLIFENCTSLNAIPALPADILYDCCYKSMFEGCTSIKISTKYGEYEKEYIIGSRKNYGYSDPCRRMFFYTGGTFTGTPELGQILYTSNEIIYP